MCLIVDGSSSADCCFRILYNIILLLKIFDDNLYIKTIAVFLLEIMNNILRPRNIIYYIGSMRRRSCSTSGRIL